MKTDKEDAMLQCCGVHQTACAQRAQLTGGRSATGLGVTFARRGGVVAVARWSPMELLVELELRGELRGRNSMNRGLLRIFRG